MKKFIFVVSFLVLLTLLPFLVTVKNVSCQSQYGPCSPALEEKLRNIIGKKLFFVKSKVKNILLSDPSIDSFSTQFKIPDKLLINIITKKPEFAIKNVQSGKVNLVTVDGKVLTTVEDSSLPTIEVQEELKFPGEVISDKNLFASKILLGLNKMYQVTSGKIENDNLTFVLPNGMNLIFDTSDDYNEASILLGALRLIESKLESDNQNNFSVIDMRYKNPVLR